MSYREAIDLVAELKREFGSHLAGEKWSFVAGYGEVMAATSASVLLNVNRDRKLFPKPIELPMPWDEDEAEPVTPERRVELKQQLRRRSAFAN